MIELLSVVRAPHITEKSTRLQEESAEGKGETLCFRVHSDSTKVDVRRAVERLFDVKVDSVRLASVPPKRKRFRNYQGFKPGWRKAYVKLKPGHSVEYFEGV